MSSLTDWLQRKETRTSSMITLIAVNLLPLFGVFYWGWEIFPIMMLYWSENVIVGMYNILRMIFCRPQEPAGCVGKLFMIPFFTLHYGLFTLAHGFFVVTIFNSGLMEGAGDPNPQFLWGIILENNMIWAVLALFLSHGYSFIRNYIGKGEFRRVSLNELMMKPYSRVIILHLTLILGAFLVYILQLPVAGLILFILLKIIIDLIAHAKEHKKMTDSNRHYQRS